MIAGKGKAAGKSHETWSRVERGERAQSYPKLPLGFLTLYLDDGD